ncbi:MAG: GNAT family N-acetyltransferase [Burkholderiales bacterium]|nr:GNAT family N-acetyltransferase [Burkholderiales bacterium]
MSVGVSIKRLSRDDGGRYRALMLRAYSEHDTAFTSTFEERAGKPLDWWSKRLADPTTVTLGAFDASDVLIGTVRLETYQRLRERHKVALTAMYVMKDHAGHGIGRRLVEEALQAARRLPDIEIINLTVTADNLAAVRLYSRLGFQAYGREIRAVKTATGHLDKTEMWRPVSADYVAL